ncbi:transcriptional regulator GutM [Halanaerobium sp.]|uniref:transcriptional regulator GutM n=1 Tax=Halanaerobium sp. TaxID=1895664 RepID=UPI0025BDAC17|nr:transcriptional regulator GutM [Halanaerobium sp.]
MVIFVISWILQGVLTYFQIRNYKDRMSTLGKVGYLGVGRMKKKLGRGRILLLVSNESGEVIKAEEMRGISVFTRFKEKNELIGYKIDELGKNLSGDFKEVVEEAVESIRGQLKNNTGGVKIEN